MSKNYQHLGTIVRGPVIATTGVHSQFNEKGLIHEAKKKGQIVVRDKRKGLLMFFGLGKA